MPKSAPPALCDAAFRATIASKDDYLPPTWRAAAISVGVLSADALLCHLSRSISAALESLAASAEAAREQLQTIRVAQPNSGMPWCDEIEALLNTSVTSKRAALERELCAVDSSLEGWRAHCGAMTEAALTLSDADLAVHHADLTARLEAAESRLLAQPTSVVEPPCVSLVLDAAAILEGVAGSSRVVAPRAVTAADLTLAGNPPHARAGRVLQLSLALQTDLHASQSEEELCVSLGAAAAASFVEASLDSAGGISLPLRADTSVHTVKRCLVVSIPIPSDAPVGARVCIDSVSIYGLALDGDIPGSLCIPVRRGVQTPLRLQYSKWGHAPLSMCFSPAGQLFVPQHGSPAVAVFDTDGAELPSMPVAHFGLASDACWAAYADGVSPSLLLADFNGAASRLVAVDLASRAVRWATPPESFQGCGGLAVLSGRGVVIASSASDGALHAHRLSDGARLGSLRVLGLDIHSAEDTEPGSFFGCMWNDEESCVVVRLSWALDTGFGPNVVVEAAEERRATRLVAVVPPSNGKRVSHLVVGSQRGSELLVLALPDLLLIHTHTFNGMCLKALAADPWGVALALCDLESGVLHVLAWPLPGMPKLE